MIVRPVFPDGIGIVKNTDLSLDKELMLSTLTWKTAPGENAGFSKQSQTDLYLYDEWKPLADWIKTQAKIYWNEMGWHCDDLWFTQLWCNSMSDGGMIASHRHSNSMITGCYYLKATEFSGGTVFESTKSPLELTIQTEFSHVTEFNMGQFVIPAVEDQLLLFPSYMMHHSQPNFKPTERYTVAFNLLPNTLGRENGFNLARLR